MRTVVITDYNGNLVGTMTEQDAIQRVARMSKTPHVVTLESAINVLNAISSVNIYTISMEGSENGQQSGQIR